MTKPTPKIKASTFSRNHSGGNAAMFEAPALAAGAHAAVSTLGGITPGQDVIVCGFDLLKDLVFRIDLGQAIHLFIKREIPEPQVSRLLQSMIVAMLFPDIRVWPIGAVGFAAAAGAPCSAALSCGILAFDATLFGTQAFLRTSDFLVAMAEARRQARPLGESLSAWIAEGKTAYGFGRPLVKSDERVSAVLDIARRENLAGGPWTTLVLEMAGDLKTRKDLHLNFGGLLTALLMDLSYSRLDLEAFSCCFTIINFLGVYREHADGAQPLFPLACSDIEYAGPALED